MKIRYAVFVVAILFAVGAAARTSNTKKFFLHFPASVGGVQIPAGLYDLSWKNENSTVEVTFSREGRFIGAARGVWVKHGAKYESDAALLQLNPDGSHSLIEIRLAGLKQTIAFSEPVRRVGRNRDSDKRVN
jgi:hypothetical protein